MKNTTISMTAQIPSGFAMPVCGHAYGTTVSSAGSAALVRDRITADVAPAAKGDMRPVQGTTGFTTAWRPPIC